MSEWKVEVVKITNIEPHPNADALSLTRVNGYPVIFKTGQFSLGDNAVYIPVDSVVPDTELFSFLKHKRIEAIRLRGIFSMGLLIEAPNNVKVGDDVAKLLGIVKYEQPIPLAKGGENESAPKGWYFTHYTDVQSYRKYSHVISAGDDVVLTEKIHGCNGRYVHDGDRLWVGSHHCIKKESDANLWWQAAKKLDLGTRLAKYPKHIFFGEVYGQVQDLRYGISQKEGCKFAVFDIFSLQDMKYLNYDDVKIILQDLEIDHVPVLYRGAWEHGLAETLCEGKSTIADNVREGFVIKPVMERYDDQIGRVILKLHGQGYLLRKNKSDYDD